MTGLAAPVALLGIMAPLVFVIRKRVRPAALLTLASLAAAAALIAVTPDRTDDILSLGLRLTPLGRLAAVPIRLISAVSVAAASREGRASNSFPSARAARGVTSPSSMSSASRAGSRLKMRS